MRHPGRLPGSRRALGLRLLAAGAAFVVCLAIAACGAEDESLEVEEGVPVELGELQYTVLFSRFLNPEDVEDREYLVGQPAPTPEQLYLGVFVQVLNKSKEDSQTIPPAWIVTDTEHNEYRPLPSESPYALRLGASVGAEDQVPALDSTPDVGPIAGSLLLFLIPDSATDSRPLELTIPGQGGPATVELDA
jgi:hypothetical protein